MVLMGLTSLPGGPRAWPRSEPLKEVRMALPPLPGVLAPEEAGRGMGTRAMRRRAASVRSSRRRSWLSRSTSSPNTSS